MTEHIVRILQIEQVTHDVKRFQVEKPEGYAFIPGQATDVSINTPELKNKKRAFSFTCLNKDPYLEFTIKIYPKHQGITVKIDKLQVGDQLIVRDAWGAIEYKGKGLFIAGGAGITPFISIFRDLQAKNELEGNALLFGNRTKDDIIMEDEFNSIFGSNFINILSDEQVDGYAFGLISQNFIVSHSAGFNRFYVCGPPPMMKLVLNDLKNLGIPLESITTETI